MFIMIKYLVEMISWIFIFFLGGHLDLMVFYREGVFLLGIVDYSTKFKMVIGVILVSFHLIIITSLYLIQIVNK